MPRLAYVDGQYLPPGSARVHIEGRGHQFSTVSLLPIGSGAPAPSLEDCASIPWLMFRKRYDRDWPGADGARSRPAPGNPVRLGQYVGRQLDHDPRSAQRGHGSDGKAVVVDAANQGARAAQPA